MRTSSTGTVSAPTRRTFVSAAGAAVAGAALAGCTSTATDEGSAAGSAAAGSAAGEGATESVEVRVGSLKGPTSIGLVRFMEQADAGETENTYSFTISGTADEILPQVIQGKLDIALIPANAAAVLFSKTEGAVSAININTLGVLSVVTGDASVTAFEDLAGRTVLMTGKGTTPEYAMRYLLDCAGIADQVTLEFKSEATEVTSALVADATAVGVLPQPYVTAALTKNEQLSAPIDLTEVWDECAAGSGSQLVTGATIVRNEFLDEHRSAVEEFLAGQRASVESVNADPAGAAPLVVEAGIVEAEPIAEKAIPACHVVCITGQEMKDALSGYLDVLYDQDPSSVGGAAPDDAFYAIDLEA